MMLKLNYFLVAPYSVKDVSNATEEECLEYLSNIDIVSIDIETTRKFKGRYGEKEGLDPYLSEIVMLQVGDDRRQYVIDTRFVPPSKILESIVDKLLIGHNLKFEYKHILVNYGIRLKKVYDTMIAEMIIYNGLNQKFTLESLNKRYLGVKVDKTTRNEFASIGKTKFTKRQIKYGAEDILYPYAIRPLQAKEIKEKRMDRCVALEMQFVLVLGDIETAGMNFNKEVWMKAYKDAYDKYTGLGDKLDDYVVNNHDRFCDKQLSLFEAGIRCAVQWTSSKQVIEFFDYLKICPTAESKTTKKVRKTVESKELKVVLTDDNLKEEYRNLINDYLKFKEAEQAVTTFGKSFFKYINPITNRIHSNYRQIMNTGRISSGNPNLQNIPSNKVYRMAFDAPEGCKIVNADYAGQEQIVLANKSMDEDLLAFYDNGHSDMHSFVASKIYPELFELSLPDIKKFHKDKRQIAKAAGFAINYGGTGFTIAKNLGISESQGNSVYEAYFKAFPGLKNYFLKCNTAAVSKGYILIDEITGRRYTFPEYEELLDAKRNNMIRHYFKLKGKLERNSLNYPIQGTSGSITKLAAIYIRKYLLENNAYEKFQITNLIHDEINCEAKEEHAEECAKVVEDCMQRAGLLWCQRIPLKAEAAIGNYWAH